jgi:hypothetical protein
MLLLLLLLLLLSCKLLRTQSRLLLQIQPKQQRLLVLLLLSCKRLLISCIRRCLFTEQ